MDSSGPQPPVPPAVFECLTRVQRMLLAAGYCYVAGDADTWPLTMVQMVKAGDVLLVAPWIPGIGEELAAYWSTTRAQLGGSAGLLLVGTAETEDPGVRGFFQQTAGAVGYLDARGGQFRLRRGKGWKSKPNALQKHHLRRFLDPAAGRKSASIDCRGQLHRHLEDQQRTRAFIERARRVEGFAKPRVTIGLIAACIAVFVAMLLLGDNPLDPKEGVLLKWGALYGPRVRAGETWRIVSCALLHIGVAHLAFNMFAMYFFGKVLELLQGRWRLGGFFLFSVVTASLTSLWWHPETISAGASGGLFGMVGATLGVLLRFRRDFPPKFWKGLRNWIVTILVYNAVFFALMWRVMDNAAHAGGLIGGLLIGLVLGRSPVRSAAPRWWAWVAAAILGAAAAAFGSYAVGRIPADAPLDPPGIVREREKREKLAPIRELMSLLNAGDATVEETRKLSQAARSKTMDPRAAARKIREELLPKLEDKESAERLLRRAERVPDKEGQLRPQIEALLEARVRYAHTVLRAVEAPGDDSRIVEEQREDLRLHAARSAVEQTLHLIRIRTTMESPAD